MTILATTLLAIGPAIVILPGIFAGLYFGLRHLLRRRNALPEGPGASSTPFLNMQSGVTTAMLERNATGWAWTLSGSSNAVGSDPDSGKAVLAMAQAIAEAEEAAPITGSAGGPGIATVDFGVQPEDDAWHATLTTLSKLPAPAPPSLLGSATLDERGAALLYVLQQLAKHIDWLTYAGPAMDAVGEPPPPPMVAPGIVVSGDTVAITDLPSWVAFKAPEMREDIEAGLTADQILDEHLGRDLPESATLNGKSIADVRTSLQKVLDAVREGTYLGREAPDRMIAALIVGGELDVVDWWVDTYKDHTLLARPVLHGGGGGGFAQAGKRYEWRVWQGTTRGYDSDVHARGVMPAGKSLSQTTRYVKQQIDQGFPTGTGDAGGNTTGTVDPDWNEPKMEVVEFVGAFTPPPGRQALCATTPYLKLREKKLPRIGWAARKTVEVELFPVGGNWAVCKSYDFEVGVCLRQLGSFPYGGLSPALANYATFPMEMLPIVETTGGTMSQSPQWGQPPTWKSGLRCRLELDGGLHIAGGITKTNGIDEGPNACPGKKHQWPDPKGPHFNVWSQSSTWERWNPTPTLELFVEGSIVKLRVTYSGFPRFKKFGNEYRAEYVGSRPTLYTKVRAVGHA